MRSAFLAAALFFVPIAARADGLLDQLPADGSWAEFDVAGKAYGANGDSRVTVIGTLRLSSVGHESVNGEACRWIEVKSTSRFERGDRRNEAAETIKLLIPEQYLKRGQEPLAHVYKAWRQHPTVDQGQIKQLDLQGEGLREVQSLDEFFHGPAWEVTQLEPEEVESKLGKTRCSGLRCVDVQTGGGIETRLSAIIRLDKRAPFGVVTYEYEKERLRDGKSLGKRTMGLKLVDFGQDAVSALGDSR